MALEYYVGVPGVSINVESAQDLYDALNIMHTQVMDNVGEDDSMLRILEAAMEQVMAQYPEVEPAH